MVVPEKRKSQNLRKSILRHVDTNFRVANSVPVANMNYRDSTFDASGLDYWVAVDFLEEGAGRKGFTMVQFTIYSRIGGRLSTGDRYMDTLDDLADKLHDAMHVEAIQIYDYSIPSSPSAVTGAWLLVRNSDGTSREPEDDRTFPAEEDGVARRALTYRFRHIEDVSMADQYYD